MKEAAAFSSRGVLMHTVLSANWSQWTATEPKDPEAIVFSFKNRGPS
jgi:hypothetical protein